MYDFDLYNPTHHGILPVRVLQHNIIEWFENVTPDIIEDMFGETEYRDMQKAIDYRIGNSVITDSSEITREKKIVLNENFNQFLWTICYALLVLFDEEIIKPSRQDKTNEFIVSRAKNLFSEGLKLFKEYNSEVFFKLPNPEKFNKPEDLYIGKTNGIFLSAITFILLHEFGHQYYGHLDVQTIGENNVKEELDCDDFAFEKLSHKLSSEYGKTIKIGIVAALTSISFFDETLKGGDSHPDPDTRLSRQLNKMNLDDHDSVLGIACLSFSLWAYAYNKTFHYPQEVDNFRILYNLNRKIIEEIKHSN